MIKYFLAAKLLQNYYIRISNILQFCYKKAGGPHGCPAK